MSAAVVGLAMRSMSGTPVDVAVDAHAAPDSVVIYMRPGWADKDTALQPVNGPFYFAADQSWRWQSVSGQWAIRLGRAETGKLVHYVAFLLGGAVLQHARALGEAWGWESEPPTA